MPRLSIEGTTYDFGVVKPGPPLKHLFVFKNEGTVDLLIQSVSPGWGCTASDFDKVVPPGKEGRITLLIEHTEGFRDEMVKGASVTTNDPARPNFALLMLARFEEEKKPTEPHER